MVSLDNEGGFIKNVSYNEYLEEFQEFRTHLDPFTCIKDGDKIGREEQSNILYLDKSSWNQYIRRIWWQQDRYKTDKILEDEFNKFVIFLDNYSDCLSEIKGLAQLNENYNLLLRRIVTLINQLIIGLYALKQTYSDFKPIKCRIDSIILTLIDFKIKTKKYLNVDTYPNVALRIRTISF